MQLTIEEAKSKVLKNSVVSIPNSLTNKIFGKDSEFDTRHCPNIVHANEFKDLWNTQHPLIHTWLLLSSISICFLSALFLIAP